MTYQAALDEASQAALAAGIRVLQGYRLAPTDAGHVSELLRHMAPRHGARIVDVGCGFGEVARLMKAERPDLNFVLVNRNAFQLAYAPADMARVQADLHAMPLASGSADGLMYCYTLCHSEFCVALHEAARVACTGAELFVFDYARVRGDNALMQARLYARALPMADLVRLCGAAGWQVTYCAWPAGSDDVFRSAYANDNDYAAIFDDLVPVTWKARRA